MIALIISISLGVILFIGLVLFNIYIQDLFVFNAIPLIIIFSVCSLIFTQLDIIEHPENAIKYQETKIEKLCKVNAYLDDCCVKCNELNMTYLKHVLGKSLDECYCYNDKTVKLW